MKKLERLTTTALEKLRGDKGIIDTFKVEREEVTDGLGNLNCPGLLAILATATTEGGLAHADPLKKAGELAASDPRLKDSALDPQDIHRLLFRLLVRKTPSQEILQDEGIQEAVLKVAIEKLAEVAGSPISPAQARQIRQLLATGQFFKDISAVRAAVLSTIPELPVHVAKDALAFYRFPLLAGAVARDLLANIDAVPGVLMDLSDGSLDSPPAVMVHTLSFLYKFDAMESAANMVHTLLGNKTVRVAIVIYAQANRIPIKEADLDQLRKVFNAEEPDLGPAMVGGVKRLAQVYAPQKAKQIIRKLSAVT